MIIMISETIQLIKLFDFFNAILLSNYLYILIF